MLANAATACGVACMFITVISSWVYKKKFAEEYDGLVWKLPCKALICILGLAGCLILFWGSFSSSLETLICVIVIFAIILLFYQFYSKPNSEKIAAGKLEI